MRNFESFTGVLSTVNDSTFEDIALDLFRFQATQNKVYADYLHFLGVEPGQVMALSDIPFLPISFFKSKDIITGAWHPEVIFTSSGTTGESTSRHKVPQLAFYLEHCQRTFEYFFGALSRYHILSLLPSYLEREGSSLIAMADHFAKESRSSHSGFYLNDYEALVRKLEELRNDNREVLLLGVSFALLEMAERYSLDLKHCLIMETGGMKGKRTELTREELHKVMRERFNVGAILSEYGMTELMSQAYSKGEGRYSTPPWMKILIRELGDPFKIEGFGKTGGINIIDLGNLHSCAFIETHDLGRLSQQGYFEVLGRMDNSDIRGCNLLVE